MGTDHNRRVPEDLMGAILGEEHAFPEPGNAGREAGPPPGDAPAAWGENPELVGVAFNLSKQLSAELDRIRAELEEDTHPSRSEIAEVALRIAVEDVRARGRDSELVRRIEERHAAGTTSDAGQKVVRSVDHTGLILETTYDESGEVLDEDVIGNVSDLPVVDEYVDDRGRLVSLARDDLGNTFEQILDDDLNTIGARLLNGP